MIREKVIEKAHQLIGTPYRFQGRSELGCDCVGFLKILGEEINHSFDYPQDYQAPKGNLILDYIQLHYSAAQNPIPGDILVFTMTGIPHHVGLLVSDSFFIHALPRQAASKDGVVKSYLNDYWSQKLTNVFNLESYRP